MDSEFMTILMNILECALEEARRLAEMHNAAVELLETMTDVLFDESGSYGFGPEDEYDD